MSEPLVLSERRGSTGLVTLNRPAKRNAMSRDLVALLGDTLTQVAVDPGVRVLVLTGAGGTFCAGMDLREASEAAQTTESEQRAIAETSGLADLVHQLHTLPKLTIAAVNGDALAGGAGLAMACDLAVMAEKARVGYPEVLRGLVAAIVMHELVRLVGERRSRQLLLTGEPIDSATALQWGLANKVVPGDACLDEALALAERSLATGPMAVATVKRLLDEATHRLPDLRGPAAITASVRVSEEAIEGMRAFLERRPPRWAR
jgi:methylglutaconyl-CoA hydratase